MYFIKKNDDAKKWLLNQRKIVSIFASTRKILLPITMRLFPLEVSYSDIMEH